MTFSRKAKKKMLRVSYLSMRIDAIGKSRDSRYGGMEMIGVSGLLDQLLAEMDGFDTSRDF